MTVEWVASPLGWAVKADRKGKIRRDIISEHQMEVGFPKEKN